MKNARFESSSDMVRWLQTEAAGLRPACDGGRPAKNQSRTQYSAPSARLTMNGVNTRVIERKPVRLRSLGREEPRLEWRKNA
jgi:hypothetical protein